MRYILCCSLVCALFWLTSCRPKPGHDVVSTETLTRNQLTELLSRRGIDGSSGHFVVDDRFTIPTRKWVDEVFTPSFFRLSAALHGEFGGANNDCDDYARMAAWFAAYIGGNRKLDTGVAVGEFYYRQSRSPSSPGGGHAINVIIVRNGSGYEVLFYEPQTPGWTQLSRQELESCIFYSF